MGMGMGMGMGYIYIYIYDGDWVQFVLLFPEISSCRDKLLIINIYTDKTDDNSAPSSAPTAHA